MSTLSQFLGGDSTPIGQMAYLGVTDEPATLTIGSQKWLRTGVLAPATSYPSVPAEYQRVDPAPIQHETLPLGETYNSIATNDTIWVAVGEDSALATSSDGVTWTKGTIPGGHYKSVIWTGTKFAAVGSRNTTDGTVFATSPDGTNWSFIIISTASAENGNSIEWNGSMYVIVGGGVGVSVFIRTSPDGVTWTTRTVSGGDSTAGYNYVVWTGSQWVAVGRSTSYALAITSPDGITWTQRTVSVTGYNLNSIAWNGSLLVATSDSGFVWTSPDGITWTSRTFPSMNPSEVIWTGTRFFIVGTHSATISPIITSTDGITWTQVSYFLVALKCIAASGSLLMSIGSNHLARSSDSGTTWASRKPQGSNSTIAYNGSIYVIGGTDKFCSTSTDGIWWVRRPDFTLPVNKIMTSGSLFVAIGGQSSTGYITTSTDGINWTTRTSPASVVWTAGDFGAGRFVIASGTSQYSSVDGINWVNSPDLGISGSITNIKYANGIFIALASTTPGYSYDGITWRTAGDLPASLNSLAWNGSVFAAVASGVCFTSTNGVNWVSRSSTFPSGVASIYAQGGTFVAYTTNKFYTSVDCVNWSEARSGLFSIAGTANINDRIYFAGTNSVGSTSATKYVGVTTYNKFQYVRVE